MAVLHCKEAPCLENLQMVYSANHGWVNLAHEGILCGPQGSRAYIDSTYFGPGRPQNFFQGGQSRHFAYLFHIVGDATQMDVHKKKMFNVTATVANSVFPARKLTLSKCLF